jgi:prepilin-type processing-associated H-X9-DG protein
VGAFSEKVFLLPYLDQGPAYKNTNMSDFPYDRTGWLGGNNVALGAKLPVFNCPSQPYSLVGGIGNFTYSINCGVFGKQPNGSTPVDGRQNGVAAFMAGINNQNCDKTCRISDIIDGTSNTAAYSEFVIDGGVNDKYTVRNWIGDVNATPAQNRQTCLQTPASNTNGRTPLRGGTWSWAWTAVGSTYGHTLAPNDPPCYTLNGLSDWVGSSILSASSLHAGGGGVNLLMADGAVRFVGNTVDYNTWLAIGTRNGGEANGDF